MSHLVNQESKPLHVLTKPTQKDPYGLKTQHVARNGCVSHPGPPARAIQTDPLSLKLDLWVKVGNATTTPTKHFQQKPFWNRTRNNKQHGGFPLGFLFCNPTRKVALNPSAAPVWSKGHFFATRLMQVSHRPAGIGDLFCFPSAFFSGGSSSQVEANLDIPSSLAPSPNSPWST